MDVCPEGLCCSGEGYCVMNSDACIGGWQETSAQSNGTGLTTFSDDAMADCYSYELQSPIHATEDFEETVSEPSSIKNKSTNPTSPTSASTAASSNGGIVSMDGIYGLRYL